MTCAPSEVSGQPGYPPSLIRDSCPVWSESSLSAWRDLWPIATQPERTTKTVQTAWMPRLISVFAGRTCHFVGFDELQQTRRLGSAQSDQSLWRHLRVSLKQSPNDSLTIDLILWPPSCSGNTRNGTSWALGSGWDGGGNSLHMVQNGRAARLAPFFSSESIWMALFFQSLVYE